MEIVERLYPVWDIVFDESNIFFLETNYQKSVTQIGNPPLLPGGETPRRVLQFIGKGGKASFMLCHAEDLYF